MAEFNQVVFPRKLLRRFIQLYKEQRCLWDRECPDYRIKPKKHAALSLLTELVQEYDENATRVHVLRKIDSLRACVRREYKRVIESRLHADSGEEVYKPMLWYFDLFSFVFNDDINSRSASASDPVEKIEIEQSEEEEEEPSEEDHSDTYEADAFGSDYNMSLNAVDVNDRPSTSIKHQVSPDRDPYKSRRPKTSTEVDDEYDAIGINVAAKLRYLPPNMRILSEKLINDVLFQAQINGLNSSTKIVTFDPFKQEGKSDSK